MQEQLPGIFCSLEVKSAVRSDPFASYSVKTALEGKDLKECLALLADMRSQQNINADQELMYLHTCMYIGRA